MNQVCVSWFIGSGQWHHIQFQKNTEVEYLIAQVFVFHEHQYFLERYKFKFSHLKLSAFPFCPLIKWNIWFFQGYFTNNQIVLFMGTRKHLQG